MDRARAGQPVVLEVFAWPTMRMLCGCAPDLITGNLQAAACARIGCGV
jgi:hypothetical protein